MQITEQEAKNNGWYRSEYTKAALFCSPCGSFSRVSYCGTDSSDNAAVSAKFRQNGVGAIPPMAWAGTEGAKVQIFNPIQGYNGNFDFGDNSSPDDGRSTERYVFWYLDSSTTVVTDILRSNLGSSRRSLASVAPIAESPEISRF
jgi:hypothetical protein